MFPRDKAYAKLDKLLKKYPYGKSFYAVNFMGAGKFREMHPRGVYDARKKYVFEDTEIYSVSDADSWLKKMYGDYMIPPPEGERNKHFTEAE
jgi:lipopolysaccharide cholinephosphotransferase